MLANLLLITPVFYALLMFRTSKAGYLRLFLHQDSCWESESFLQAIFGSLSKRVTVDLIMHYETQLRNFEGVDFWIQNRRCKNTPRLRNSGYAVACGYWYGRPGGQPQSFPQSFTVGSCWCYGGRWIGQFCFLLQVDMFYYARLAEWAAISGITVATSRQYL